MAAHDELPTAEHNQKMIQKIVKEVIFELTRTSENDRIHIIDIRIYKHSKRYGDPKFEFRQIPDEVIREHADNHTSSHGRRGGYRRHLS